MSRDAKRRPADADQALARTARNTRAAQERLAELIDTVELIRRTRERRRAAAPAPSDRPPAG
jgi:hypothetical protein